MDALLAIPFGLAIGVAVGMLGGGGSVLAVPVLVYVLGENVREATTASLVVVTAGAVAGGLGHAREGRVCWPHAAAFVGAALPGVAAGTALGSRVGGTVLIASFAVVMLAAAAATWYRASTGGGETARQAGAACPTLELGSVLPAGVLVGFLTGFFGVGGGFLIVPALAVALAFSMRLAVGTSLAIITVTSALGLAAHLLDGRALDPAVTVAMTAACAAGALAGSALAGRVAQEMLARAFAGMLAALATYLLVSAAFLGGPPS